MRCSKHTSAVDQNDHHCHHAAQQWTLSKFPCLEFGSRKKCFELALPIQLTQFCIQEDEPTTMTLFHDVLCSTASCMHETTSIGGSTSGGRDFLHTFVVHFWMGQHGGERWSATQKSSLQMHKSISDKSCSFIDAVRLALVDAPIIIEFFMCLGNEGCLGCVLFCFAPYPGCTDDILAI